MADPNDPAFDPKQDLLEYCEFDPVYFDVYRPVHGGKWFYSQNKPGSQWFDNVSNEKGWTVDFNLEVLKVENSNIPTQALDPDGLGVYFNDGTRYESIYFLEQEILFNQADRSVFYDTTQETQYRVTGVKDSLAIYAKRADENEWAELARVPFSGDATNEGNGRKPAVYESSDGNLHAAWHDDGNGLGQLYYSKFSDSGVWSDPELAYSTPFGIQNVDLVVDSNGVVHVVYESKETDKSSIGYISRNDIGWSNPEFIGSGVGESNRPKIALGSSNDLHVVWEDHRFVQPEIFYNKRISEEERWAGEERVTNTFFGARRPHLDVYLNRVIVAWTQSNDPVYDNNTTAIYAAYLNLSSGSWSDSEIVTDASVNEADYAKVLIASSGQVYIAWHDSDGSDYEIYLRRYNVSLDPSTLPLVITSNAGESKYPTLSENGSDGKIYVLWEDDRSDPSDSTRDQSTPRTFAAIYDPLNDAWTSSGEGSSYDIRMQLEDERRSFAPSVPRSFTGEMHIIYESEPARIVDIYDPPQAEFSQVRDLIYDLTNADEYTPVSGPYLDRDQKVSDRKLRKEIRFGDFANYLSTSSTFKSFNYYLDDAVGPLDIEDISGQSFSDIDFRVCDAVVNNYGDAWLATNDGLYFYYNRDRTLTRATLPGGDGVNVRAIAFDQNNTMFISLDSSVLYSVDHNTFVAVVSAGSELSGVNSIYVDSLNRLVLGGATKVSVIDIIYNVTDTPTVDPVFSLIALIEADSGTYKINDVQVDDNDVIWVATRQGLVRWKSGHKFVFTTEQGLSSNFTYAVAIRSSSIRYLATAAGLYKMYGSSFELITSEEGEIYNNNVRSVYWQDPNILWAGTLSRLNLLLEQPDGSYRSQAYDSSDYSAFAGSYDDHKTFYIVSDPEEIISEKSYVEVYLNGNRINHGYKVTLVDENRRAIRFETPLLPSDVVEVVVRNDVSLIGTTVQTDLERRVLGDQTIRFKELKENFVTTEGDINQVARIGSQSLAQDTVILDTNPPEGCVEFVEQINNQTVRLSIEGATDDVFTPTGSQTPVSGSGIDKMIISNFSNFTSDGSTPLTPVDFAESIIHDLGVSVGSNEEIITFSSGTGSVIEEINGSLYAATSQPAAIYKQEIGTSEWNEVLTFDSDQYIDMMTFYNNKFIIGVGHDTSSGRLYSYTINSDGTFTNEIIREISGGRLYDSTSLNGVLYIATGDDGKVYSFDGNNLGVRFSGLAGDLYSITNANGNLFVSGTAGRIYRLIVESSSIEFGENTSIIAHQDGDSIIRSVEAFAFGGTQTVFAGTETTGRILRSPATKDEFNKSFQTINSQISSLKSTGTDLYAAVGENVYKLSATGTGWEWQYTAGAEIEDIVEFNDELYSLSGTGVSKALIVEDSRKVYLKLIDKAGNETSITNDEGDISECFTVSLSLDDLERSSAENQIIEIDEFGNVEFSLIGSDSYYSANRVEEETGVYTSEIFNGTNDLVKWDAISWISNEPTNTEVLMYVRTSSSSTDILTEEWVGPFSRSESSGVDLGFLTGQYLQFKAILKSEEKGITPTLTSVIVQSLTSESAHFFTTNFTLPSRLKKGIITSQSKIPVSAEVIFGINQTNSVDWSDYQIVDENRIFNSDQVGENLRVGIRFISPSRSSLVPDDYAEYGPYQSSLYINTVDFTETNGTGSNSTYHYTVYFYNDVGLTDLIHSDSSEDNPEYFSADSGDFLTAGETLANGDSHRILYNPPGTANLSCNSFYFVKIVSNNQTLETDVTLVDDRSYLAGCGASFVDTLDFDFTNTDLSTKDLHFRIRWYEDGERTNLYKTEFSGNDRTGWTAEASLIPEGGYETLSGETITVAFEPDLSDFEAKTLYYLTIDAYDGSGFLLASNAFTYQANDATSLIYCGPYFDVPVVKNFGLMFEMINNEFIKLNLDD